METRTASIRRETKETTINLDINIDGTGKADMCTGVRMMDHMLEQVARHGKFDIKVSATGDDIHHLAEDIAICLGHSFMKALGERKGIVRVGEASVPMDDALATVIVDIGGRGYSVLELDFEGNDIFEFPLDLVRHFLEAFASEAKMNLHAHIAYGRNDHHKAEALFKALGRALDKATIIDERIAGEVPSTKEYLEN